MVITKDWSIFIGNERAEDMTVDPFPLFGFGLGDFEEMVCEGWGLGGFTRTKLYIFIYIFFFLSQYLPPSTHLQVCTSKNVTG